MYGWRQPLTKIGRDGGHHRIYELSNLRTKSLSCDTLPQTSVTKRGAYGFHHDNIQLGMEVAQVLCRTNRATSRNVMIIVLDDYRKVGRAHRRGPDRQGGELAPTYCSVTSRVPTPELPEDFSQIDMKPFLDRVCALATQI